MPTRHADRQLSTAAATLAAWYGRTARDLPWRRDRDPYRVLVSEVMLQQTRVETVVPRFEQFVARFPDIRALADADEQEVLAAWSGLGYYRRARSLHAAARAVRDRHGGQLPRDPGALRALPGVGEYTAAAIAAIAWDAPILAIDGNVARVLCRLLGMREDPGRSATRRALHAAAVPLLRAHPAGAFNQALMDLGARVCLPRAPRCDGCPCATECVARHLGLQAQIPPARRQAVVAVRESAAVVVRDGRFLLFRGQRPGSLQDMWEFPTLDSRLRTGVVAEAGSDIDHDPATELGAHLDRLGIAAGTLQPLGEIRHGITSRRIRCSVYLAAAVSAGSIDAAATGAPAEHDWFTPAQITALPIAASTTKILALLGNDKGRPSTASGAPRPGLRSDREAATF